MDKLYQKLDKYFLKSYEKYSNEDIVWPWVITDVLIAGILFVIGYFLINNN